MLGEGNTLSPSNLIEASDKGTLYPPICLCSALSALHMLLKMLVIMESGSLFKLVGIDPLFPTCASSGQKLSLAKSRVFFSKNVQDSLAGLISEKLGINQTHNLGMYLGVPLLHSRMTKDNFQFLIYKVKKKLSSWKVKTLSFAGRVSLTQSCLFSLPTYVMQTTPIPLGICKEIEKLCRNFIWGTIVERRKCHLVN